MPEILTPDSLPPYTVRHMRNAAGQDIWHVLGSDGWSIVATCYAEDVARLFAAAGMKCRACSECDGSHHWLWGGHSMVLDPNDTPTAMIAECKHCDAIRRIEDGEEVAG